MSLMALLTKHHAPQPTTEKLAVVPCFDGEDKETRCRKVMLDACRNRPFEAYRLYIAAGSERQWLTELNKAQLARVTELQQELEAELAQ